MKELDELTRQGVRWCAQCERTEEETEIVDCCDPWVLLCRECVARLGYKAKVMTPTEGVSTMEDTEQNPGGDHVEGDKNVEQAPPEAPAEQESGGEESGGESDGDSE